MRVFENGRLIEEHNFFLTRESFTVFERYAEAVRRHRRPQPPQPPGGQPPEPGQTEPPEQPDYEEDYDRAPGM